MANSIIPTSSNPVIVDGKGDYIGIKAYIEKVIPTKVKYDYKFSLKSGKDEIELKTYTSDDKDTNLYGKDGQVLNIPLPEPTSNGYIDNFIQKFTSITGKECVLILYAERTDTTGSYSNTYRNFEVQTSVIIKCPGRKPEFTLEEPQKINQISIQKELMSNDSGYVKITAKKTPSALYTIDQIQVSGVPGNNKMVTWSGNTYTFNSDKFTNPGSYTVTVKVKTTNGDVATISCTPFTVFPYTPAVLNVTEAKRVDYDPKKPDKEKEYEINLEASIIPCERTYINSDVVCTAKINNAGSVYTIPVTVADNKTKATINFTGKLTKANVERGLKINDYIDLLITFTDSTNKSIKLTYRFGTAATTFHLMAGGKAATFGGFCDGTENKLTSEWEIRAKEGIDASNKTIKAGTVATGTLQLGDKTIKSVGIEEYSIARGNHKHGPIGADGKAYNDDGSLRNSAGVVFVNDSGNIAVATRFQSKYILSDVAPLDIDGTKISSSAGSSSALARADHIHKVLVAKDPDNDKNLDGNTLVTKNYVDVMYSKLKS